MPRSAARLWDDGRFAGVQVGEIARVDPDDLAQRYWELLRDRDQHEVLAV